MPDGQTDGVGGGPAGPAADRVPSVVATLLGTGQLATALPCLASLVRLSVEPLRLRVHDDGTLTAADHERLAAAVGPLDVLPRSAADRALAELLAPYPALRAFRAASPLAAKLLDVPLLAAGDSVAYCDTDVLFRRSFRGLFSRPEGCGALFMADVQHAYTVRSWHRLRGRWLRLPGRVNTGILAFDRRHLDLALLERFVARPGLLQPPAWAEQTAWALLGGRAGCHLLDPRQLVIPGAATPLDPGAVGFHFVSPLRHRLAEALALPPAADAGPVALRSRPARMAGPLSLLVGELLRRLRR